MKRLFLLAFPVFFLCAPLCRGAEPARGGVRFDTAAWDFGAVDEHGGSVSHTFSFTNCGEVPVVIESVRTTCGCAIPRYSKVPVLPGKTGHIRILFDPTNRPGAFDKQLSVKFSGTDTPVALSVRGTVVSRARSRAETHPFPAGEALRLTHEALNFALMQQGTARTFRVGYVNASARELTLSFRTEPAAPWLRIAGGGRTKAGEAGTVGVTCEVLGDPIFGRRTCRLIPLVGGRAAGNGISVTMVATDNFDGVDPDDAPCLTTDAAFYAFGSVRAAECPEHTFILTNTGTRPLIVRHAEGSRGVAVAPRAPFTIAPGEKTALRCRIAATDPGKFTGVVTLVTNSPSKPLRNLRLSADIRR